MAIYISFRRPNIYLGSQHFAVIFLLSKITEVCDFQRDRSIDRIGFIKLPNGSVFKYNAFSADCFQKQYLQQIHIYVNNIPENSLFP